jgi:hypothetical protein
MMPQDDCGSGADTYIWTVTMYSSITILHHKMSTIVSTPTPSTVAAETAAVDAAQPHFIPFDLPASNQRVLGSPHPTGALLPLALKPDSDTTLDGAIATVRKLQEKGTLTSLLATHGALLFRGVPITEVGDFSRFAHAFGYASHEIIGIVSR